MNCRQSDNLKDRVSGVRPRPEREVQVAKDTVAVNSGWGATSKSGGDALRLLKEGV